MLRDIVNKLKQEILKEATGDSTGSRGSYTLPMRPGKRIFDKTQLSPFNTEVSEYFSQELATDSYDGSMDTPKKKIKKLESKAKESSMYAKSHPVRNDDDGDTINPFPAHGIKKIDTEKTYSPFTNKLNEWKYEEAPILTSPLSVKYSNKKTINEVTSTNSKRSYISPLLPGYREFTKNQNGPFTEYVNKWDHAELDHDSLDGSMSTSKKEIKKKEKFAEKVAKFIKRNPDPFAWADDAGIINTGPGKSFEAKPIKDFNPKKTVTKLDENKQLDEDLAVWFGTKKKPKGSNQPKGPWVNICRKVDGKHPPCGRSEANTKGYPKCRAAGVAGKMTDSQKKAACAQKRSAEKKDPKIGTGNKPTMTSYKPKKK